jgi:hypothetical protein
MTDPPIRENIIEMLHEKSGIMRRGSVTLKVHRNLCRVLLRGIFGPKRDEVIGGWRKLHNEELRI